MDHLWTLEEARRVVHKPSAKFTSYTLQATHVEGVALDYQMRAAKRIIAIMTDIVVIKI